MISERVLSSRLARDVLFAVALTFATACGNAVSDEATARGDGAAATTPNVSPGRATLPSDAGSSRADSTTAAQPSLDAGSLHVDATTAVQWAAGDYPPGLNDQTYLAIKGVKGQADDVRGYKVHVPPSYRPETATPLVFAIHGLGQNAVMFAVDGAGWPKKADVEGFILVIPTGNVQNDDGTWGTLGSWNAGECCGGAAIGGADDVALIRAILAEVETHLNVDKGRVYATGFSNGGFLSYRLACEAADLFAAIAPASGAIGSPAIAPMGVGNSDFMNCAPSAHVSVLAMHGSADPLVSYDYMKPSLDFFAKANGCSAATMPAKVPASAGDTTCITYTGCPEGIEVTGCTVDNGGHCWFGSQSCGFGVDLDTLLGNNSEVLDDTDAAWTFLKRFARR